MSEVTFTSPTKCELLILNFLLPQQFLDQSNVLSCKNEIKKEQSCFFWLVQKLLWQQKSVNETLIYHLFHFLLWVWFYSSFIWATNWARFICFKVFFSCETACYLYVYFKVWNSTTLKFSRWSNRCWTLWNCAWGNECSRTWGFKTRSLLEE